jgi:hypothetical protein
MNRRWFPIALFSAVSSLMFAQDVPLTNWTVPTYHASSVTGGLTTMSDVTPGVGFVGIQPCRVADTRGNGAPIQGGIFANSALRTWDLTGLCGIPAGTDAISANFTVVAAGGIPPGSFLLAWPTGQAPPPTAIMTYGPGQIISNAAIVPLGPGEQLNVNVSGSTHIVMDVNGYFTDQYNPGVSFHAVSSVPYPGATLIAENTSTGAGAMAIQGVITSTSAGSSSAAVRGINNNNTNNNGIGVWGSHAGAGWGVSGSSQTGIGTVGQTFGSIGIGVLGVTASTNYGNAGVWGADGGGTMPGLHFPAGVRGESHDYVGVLGLSYSGFGVVGQHVDSSGSPTFSGYLGTSSYGVSSYGPASVTGNLQVTGNFSSANKWFVEPHPYDASKEIRYVSLEGPHAEVYFRGTQQISRGVTRIAIPQDFRFVADAGTYSTLVTPTGAMATVAVMSQGEEGIVVQASRDVKVSYVVYAERKAVKNPNPIAENEHFRPEPDHDVFKSMPESYRRLLIQNGTLNPDGTLNMETARRLGWDKEWEKRRRPTPQPSED